jgi:hypothetical protein
MIGSSNDLPVELSVTVTLFFVTGSVLFAVDVTMGNLLNLRRFAPLAGRRYPDNREDVRSFQLIPGNKTKALL